MNRRNRPRALLSHKKANLEKFLQALGWPWNRALSLELDDLVQALEARQ